VLPQECQSLITGHFRPNRCQSSLFWRMSTAI
jgi:hypothetical protein